MSIKKNILQHKREQKKKEKEKQVIKAFMLAYFSLSLSLSQFKTFDFLRLRVINFTTFLISYY